MSDSPVVINVLVTEFTTYEMTVDPVAPEWRWLLRYPDREWPELLRQSANETGGRLSNMCNFETATGAWREVNCTAVCHPTESGGGTRELPTE